MNEILFRSLQVWPDIFLPPFFCQNPFRPTIDVREMAAKKWGRKMG